MCIRIRKPNESALWPRNKTEKIYQKYIKAHEQFMETTQQFKIARQESYIAQQLFNMTIQKYAERQTQLNEAAYQLCILIKKYNPKYQQQMEQLIQDTMHLDKQLQKMENQSREILYELNQPPNMNMMVSQKVFLRLYMVVVELNEKPHQYHETQRVLEKSQQQYEEAQQLQENVRQSKYLLYLLKMLNSESCYFSALL